MAMVKNLYRKMCILIALYASNLVNVEAFLIDVTVHNIAFDNSVSPLFFFALI